MESWREELYHHGILGQKWGKRNGPPYPLSVSQKSTSEKSKSHDNKMVKNQKQESLGHKIQSFKKRNGSKRRRISFEQFKKKLLDNPTTRSIVSYYDTYFKTYWVNPFDANWHARQHNMLAEQAQQSWILRTNTEQANQEALQCLNQLNFMNSFNMNMMNMNMMM